MEDTEKGLKVVITDAGGEEHAYAFPRRTRLLVENGQKVKPGDQLNEGSIYPHDLLAYGGKDQPARRTATEVYLVKEVQKVYKSQGVDIKDKHIEVIVRQMMKKVRIDQKGDTTYLPGQFVDRNEMLTVNGDLKKAKKEQAQYEEIILGITKASLATDSFLSAASFQETTKVLTDAALEGKTDRLLGLKENVIIGKLIPAATGLRRYRRLEIEPTEPIRRHTPEELDDARGVRARSASPSPVRSRASASATETTARARSATSPTCRRRPTATASQSRRSKDWGSVSGSPRCRPLFLPAGWLHEDDCSHSDRARPGRPRRPGGRFPCK